MNALVKAMAEIKFNIPPEVLQIGFVENFNRVNHVVSLDERILNSVIRARVIVDANLNGGTTVRIPVDRCEYQEVNGREWILTVPKVLTQGKSIVSALSLVSFGQGYTTFPINKQSPLLTASTHLFNNLTTENVVQTSRLELIGDNVILVEDPSMNIFNAMLRCVLEYSADMGELNPRHYGSFAKLCVLGTKSYIYNNCKVKLDQGYVYGGHELGSIGEVIDSYSDAEEMYQEHLKLNFKKLAFMSNTDNMARLIKASIGNVF